MRTVTDTVQLVRSTVSWYLEFHHVVRFHSGGPLLIVSSIRVLTSRVTGGEHGVVTDGEAGAVPVPVPAAPAPPVAGAGPDPPGVSG